MYNVIFGSKSRHEAVGQVAGAGISLGIAEALYHFHSFSLEALAFLATWFVLDGIRTAIAKLVGRGGVQ